MENESEIEERWKNTKLKFKNHFYILLENNLLKEQHHLYEIINKDYAKVGGSRQVVSQFINNLSSLK